MVQKSLTYLLWQTINISYIMKWRRDGVNNDHSGKIYVKLLDSLKEPKIAPYYSIEKKKKW